MGITLVINPGSTSKKYALYKDSALIFSLRFEETGDGFGVCREKNGEVQKCEVVEAKTYRQALEHFLSEAKVATVIEKASDISNVGVRIVAPGRPFQMHQRITDTYVAELEAREEIAPLHIPVVLKEIMAAKALIAQVPLYGISDSVFHSSIPLHRRKLAINASDAAEYEIERFGYHGLSMASVARRTGAFFGVAPDRVVAVHVGGGISATALHYSESVDTSMGFSPTSGIMMGSRVGDFDADALIALMERKGMRSIGVLTRYLNNESGFTGLTGFSDLRLVLNKFTEGDPAAAEALSMFRYQLHRQIGAHVALLGGLDAFVFTGTAVVRNPFLRGYLLTGLEGLGLVTDNEKNDSLIGKEGMIHSDRGEVSIGVMKNDEMGEIARLVLEMDSKGQ